jgi:hypothetical protein
MNNKLGGAEPCPIYPQSYLSQTCLIRFFYSIFSFIANHIQLKHILCIAFPGWAIDPKEDLGNSNSFLRQSKPIEYPPKIVQR